MSFSYRHGDRPLEGYTILRGIGRGGFGEVYFALSDGGREVALKVIQQNHDIELRGVRHCMNLKSPHLVSIFDVKRNDDGLPFVIMELVTGQSLRDIVRAHADGLGPERAVFLVREISRGLDYLHERGIVHRDLKPENIFYEDGYVKIGDYGLAKFISVSRQSAQTISVGTVHYMAPEIGSGNYHRGIDMYALGVILYELLTGRVPYNGDSMGEIIMKHLTAEPDLAGIDTRLHGVITKALAKKPADRYGTVEALLGDLLAEPGLARLVNTLDPSSFISVTPEARPIIEIPGKTGSPADRTPDVPAPDPVLDPALDSLADSPTIAAPGPTPSTPPPSRPRSRRRRGGGVEGTGAAPGDRDLEPRIAQGVATAAGMALAMSFFASRRQMFSIESIAGCFLVILAGTAAIFAIERWLAPRFRIDLGIAKRVMTLGLAGPALALSLAIFPVLGPSYTKSLPAIFACLLLIKWSARTRATREEPASLGDAFLAGLCGWIAGHVLHASNAIFVGGLMASLSLVLNAASPYVLPKKRQRTKQTGGKQPLTPKDHAPREKANMATMALPPSPEAPRVRKLAAVSAPAENRLVRPLHGRLVGGVCAGIAARYDWELVWVRAATLLGLVVTFGWGLIGYAILWVTMPAEEVPEPVTLVPVRSGAGRAGRFLWYVFSVLLAGAGLAAVAFAASETSFRHVRVNEGFTLLQDQAQLSFYAGIGTVFLAGFAFFRGSIRTEHTFWTRTAMPLLLVATLTAFAGTVAVAALFPLSNSENAVSATVILVSGLLSALLGSRIISAARRRRRSQSAVRIAESQSGWLALGTLLVVTALAIVAAGTVVATGPGQALIREAGIDLPTELVHFSLRDNHLVPGLALYLPGMFCLLLARRNGGASHVLRGAVGWGVLGVFAGLLALVLPHQLPVDSSTRYNDGLAWIGEVGGLVTWRALFALFLGGVVGIVCIAWPGRAFFTVENTGTVENGQHVERALQ